MQREPRNSGSNDQQRFLQLEVPQEYKTHESDCSCFYINHCLPGQDGSRSSDGPGSSSSCPFDEGLDLWVGAMPDKPAPWQDHAEIDWEEDAGGRHKRTRETADKITDEGRGNHDRTWCIEADGDCVLDPCGQDGVLPCSG
jgi:hypothetical protein